MDNKQTTANAGLRWKWEAVRNLLRQPLLLLPSVKGKR